MSLTYGITNVWAVRKSSPAQVQAHPAPGKTITKTLAICLISAALAACAQPLASNQEVIDAASARATAAADLLGQRLTGELVAAMAEGGTIKAVSVCKDRAPAIAAEIARTSGVEIGRTALRVRNSSNAPNPWESEALRRFEIRHAAGEPWPAISEQAVVGSSLHWMRPIPMAQMCSACHGTADAISDETRETVRLNYPSDQATGFEVGALRGAFTARVPLGDRVARKAD